VREPVQANPVVLGFRSGFHWTMRLSAASWFNGCLQSFLWRVEQEENVEPKLAWLKEWLGMEDAVQALFFVTHDCCCLKANAPHLGESICSAALQNMDLSIVVCSCRLNESRS
jgi:hypothetical protein